MNFQVPSTTAANTGSFVFGVGNTIAAKAPASKPTFSFGATGGGDAGAKPPTFSLGTAAAPAAAAAAVTTIGAAPATTAAPSFGFNVGSGVTITPLGGNTTTTAIGSATSGFNFATSTTATTSAPTTSTIPTFNFSTPTISTTTTSAVAPSITAAPVNTAVAMAAPVTTSSGFASLSTATKTTDSSAINTATQISYNQLEEHINKWTLEMEEQEKIFTDQATQINAWDKILINNNEKIFELNEAVQKVKSDQHILEQELEFIATQHKELEESILPLQKEFMKIPQVDVERAKTYLMVENLDTQLKQMSEDLKEIIDNLNESGKSQNNTDPIIQIGKILNAHMSSLQWIEHSTTNISNKLEEITEMHETFKRDSERSFRSAYYK